jgi:hypothetical protein
LIGIEAQLEVVAVGALGADAKRDTLAVAEE